MVDSGANLNAYSKVDNQSACCAPPAVTSSPLTLLPATNSSVCCGSEVSSVHDGLADLVRKHDVNAYAASAKVYAIEP
ncbi:MAG TPA: hypothetical protein VGN72_13055 [Tepidisphaeraceae bacterium]|nr:hypothetical protein [Tepidisphaeraceae bacterium]